MHNKRVATKLITSLLTLLIVFTTVIVMPNSTSYAAKTINELRGELSDILEDKENAQKSLDSIEKEVNAIQADINSINSEISILNDEIKEIKSRLKAKQAEIDEQEGNLDARLVAMYKKGSIGFVDVLLGSNSISEFVSNVKLLKLIHKYDKEVVELLQSEYKELAAIKEELDSKNTSLAAKKKTLTSKKSELKKKQESLAEDIEEYDGVIGDLTQQILELSNSNTEYIGGTFVWPLDSKYRSYKRINSRVGWRLHPIQKVWRYHGGTDIGAPGGATIYACGTGKVTFAGVDGGFGNCVYIDHGGGVVSIYAHCSKLYCKTGDIVVAGEKIAAVGKTGAATGNHLHFEVRVNKKVVDSLQYYPDIYEILGP